MTKAWLKPVGRKYVIVIESTIFPGHRTTLPLSFTTPKQAFTYCKRNDLVPQLGDCPLPVMPQGRPTRETVSQQELRTLMRDMNEKGD